IRHLRRVTLRTVAERADLSESFLSQVERGRANASVASLKRIAAALGVIVGELDAGGSTGDDAYTHGDSEELLVVLEGVVSLQLGSEVFELSTGDSIDYRSLTPPRLVNTGGDPGGGVVIT